jgi:hypothetical protein
MSTHATVKPAIDSTAAKEKARCFSLEDMAKIIAASDGEEKVLYWAAAETRMRAGELDP